MSQISATGSRRRFSDARPCPALENLRCSKIKRNRSKLSRMKPVYSAALLLSLLALIAALVVLPWSWSQPPPIGGPQEARAATSKTLSRADQTAIRVAVTPTPQKQIELSIDGPYQLRPVGSDKVLSRGQQLEIGRAHV